MTCDLLLALDIGSSSVKAALLDGTDVVGDVVSESFPTRYDGDRAEVDAEQVEAALFRAVRQFELPRLKAVGLTGMGPAWLAMDERGDALTPLITHQDRRSLREAMRIERTVGHGRHLALAGNRPTPGGLSSTTAAWFATNTDVIDRAHRLGHLPTYLGHRLTKQFAIDPSNAGFSGLMDVTTGGWSDSLCRAAGVPKGKLPPIVDAAVPIGLSVENDLGIPAELPVFGGYVDGSGPLLVAGAKAGQLVHSAGSTDVLALCLDQPAPREGLLCRPLGTNGKWVAAATQAAGGAGLHWARQMFFFEADDAAFATAVEEALKREPSERFHPHLAGDRQKVRQPTGGFENLTLASERHDLLAAVLRALLADHLERLRRLLSLAESLDVEVLPTVTTTGAGELLAEPCHAAWPERHDGQPWAFEAVEQATLRGLGALRTGV